MTSDNGKRHDGILPKSFRKGNGGEKGVCVVRVVVGVVVMDDVVVGGWFSKMRQIVSTVECTMFINTQGTFGK